MYTGEDEPLSIQEERTVTYTEERVPLCIQRKGVQSCIQGKTKLSLN